MDLNKPKYDAQKTFVWKQREKGKDWSEIINFKTSSFEDNAGWLVSKVEEGWPSEFIEIPDLWSRLVNDLHEIDKVAVEQKIVEQKGAGSSTCGNDIDSEVEEPTAPTSAWQKYKAGLLQNGFPKKTADEIGAECLKTLRFLKPIGNVEENKQVKGLVIGHVQSGKTANMAGLMAMAADWGFNMFIVLSGTIENLRQQTQDRLFNDLNKTGCRQKWHGLPAKLKPNMGEPYHSLHFFTNIKGDDNFLTVSLKQKTNLDNLIGWLEEYPSTLRRMKILLIDDEADQASINTKKKEAERTAINNIIIKLTELQSNSMNYVAYTATPYANVLNEVGENTLYPRTFIRALPSNKNYFGPELLFGSSRLNHKNNGEPIPNLDILRDVSDADVEAIKEIQLGESETAPPETLIDSVAWFICAAAARRHLGQTSPTSMLIHTSHLQIHHAEMESCIRSILGDPSLMERCKTVYERESKRLTVNTFYEQYPDYEGEPNEYPSFKELKANIKELLSQLGYIKTDQNVKPVYNTGLHLCVDNSSYKKGLNDEGEHVRLIYPSKSELRDLGFSPAFIVIGGATLSRGLTLEGLVSTYFLRLTKLGDSLMQMGRWFGYRQNYELLPRIWMTKNAIEQFSYLAEVEADLRQELERYDSGSSPQDFSPKILSWAPAKLLRITAANKMQAAVNSEWDFSGISNETTMFPLDEETLKDNIRETENFLNNQMTDLETSDERALVFRDVEFELIADYLRKIEFHPRSRVFKCIDIFIEWFNKVNIEDEGEKPFTNWNVIVPGLKGLRDWDEQRDSDNNKVWRVKDKCLIKGSRSRKPNQPKRKNELTIGSLQITLDQFLDLPAEKQPNKTPKSDEERRARREEAGLDKTPQLIIYRIDGQGVPQKAGSEPLNISQDLIGLTLRIPGKKNNKNMVRKIQAEIPGDAYLSDGPDINDAEYED